MSGKDEKNPFGARPAKDFGFEGPTVAFAGTMAEGVRDFGFRGPPPKAQRGPETPTPRDFSRECACRDDEAEETHPTSHGPPLNQAVSWREARQQQFAVGTHYPLESPKNQQRSQAFPFATPIAHSGRGVPYRDHPQKFQKGFKHQAQKGGITPYYTRFTATENAEGFLEIRDTLGRPAPFTAESPLRLDRFDGRYPGGPPNVLLRNYTLFELNLFPDGRGARLSAGGSPQKLAGSVVEGGLTVPWIAIAGIEATSARDPLPTIATCVASFPSVARVVPGRKRGVPVDAATDRSIVGGQACTVDTRYGARVLAAYRVNWTSVSGVSYREIWIVEMAQDGTVVLSPLPAITGVIEGADLVYPAIAAGVSGRDRAFLAWSVRTGGEVAMATAIITRTSSGWTAGTVMVTPWPVYPGRSDAPNIGFYAGVAADTDFSAGEYVLGAAKDNALPFLARYSGAAMPLATPQAIGACGEVTHATVELRVHPVTGRVLLQLQHNFMYFERSGAGFQALDNMRRPVDLTMPVLLPDGTSSAPCNVVFPFFGSGVVSIGESSAIGIGHLPGSEFAAMGPPAGVPRGRLSTSILEPRGTLANDDGIWFGAQLGQQLLRMTTHQSQVIVSQPDTVGAGLPFTRAVVLGAVR